MIKKKVSFDIDQEKLLEVKSFCETKNIKLSDFYRNAVIEKLENDKDTLCVYIFANSKIEKIVIRIKDYEIDVFEASKEMALNVGAKLEGVLRLKEEIKNPNEKIIELLKENKENKLHFFTRD